MIARIVLVLAMWATNQVVTKQLVMSIQSGQQQTGSLSMVWNASPTAGVTYSVYVGLTSGGPYTLRKSGLTVRTYTDTNLASGVYYYVVTAVDKNNAESKYSNEAQGVVP